MASDVGERLAAQAPLLRLLCEHLAGAAVRSRVETEDLVQEVFLRALARPADVPASEPGEATLRRWLGGVARHTVLDVVRSLRSAKRDGREEPLLRSDWSTAGLAASSLRAHTPGPATRAALAEGDRALIAAYRRLTPDHRRVLGLRQFQGLSALETAQRMGRSEAAVHSLYRRALDAWAEAAR